MFLVITKNIIRCNKSRHISTGLLGQVIINIPVIFLPSRAANRFIDIPRTTIISRNHQYPVLVNAIQIVQIMDRRFGRQYRVPSFIYKRIDFQFIHFPGRIHKLPKAASSGTRKSPGIQSTFNHRQIFQLQRHTFRIQRLLKNRKVILT